MSVKRAHMVSKGYLRPWGDKRGRVDVVDLEHERRLTTTIESATVVRYAYETEVLTHDLEAQFDKVESDGIPGLVKLRHRHPLTAVEKHGVIDFIDMHLHRGRYANQAQARTPAVILKSDGSNEEAELNLGDRLILSQYMKETLHLTGRGLEEWPWAVHDVSGLATGDGAVLLWRETPAGEFSTVTFPVSPTQVLIIGRVLDYGTPFNSRLAKNSRRWIVGEVGTLNRDRNKRA